MDQKPKITRTYRSHRESQRERILEAAERLFIEQGIDGISLSDIARAARVTRNTVYEYFPNKQEVAWAILQKIFEQGSADFQDAPGGSGFERIRRAMFLFIERANPDHSRYIVEFNSMYAREGGSERMRAITGRSPDDAPGSFYALVRLGIADGSLRPDLDPDLVAAAIWNLLSGMNARFALLGEHITTEYGRPPGEIFREILRAFLRGIQSNTSGEC